MKQPTAGQLPETRGTIMVFKGLSSFRRWVYNTAKRRRIPASVLVELALVRWAETEHEPLPPARLQKEGE